MEKKMFKLMKIICLVTFILGLTVNAYASTESQALVDEGRVLLFNSGNPTYSGILAANEKFKAAVAADSTDQEANFFFAVTRLFAFGLEEGSGGDLETLRDLFEAFGMTRNETDNFGELPFNDPPEIYGHLNLLETAPTGEDVRAFLAGPFMDLVNAAMGNLNVITDTNFNITLLASETGELHDVEVDYGDILLVKSALYTLKSFLMIVTAYDLDVDIREIVALGNAGVFQIQRDLLDRYSEVLELLPTDDISADGEQLLADSKTALLNGINAYRDAFNFITTESDDQADDLVYFGDSEEINEASFFLAQLTELQNSLNENRSATFTEIEESWILTDQDGNKLRMEIEKDGDGNFKNGELWGIYNCEFLFGGGWVETYSVSGTTLTMEVACGGIITTATLIGQFNAEGNLITEGTFTVYNSERGEWTGTFTGVLERTETDTFTIDFNCVFGNTDKSPLDISEVLPEFDKD